MTLDTYAHVMDTTLRAAADQMDDELNLDEPDENSQGEADPLMSKAPRDDPKGPLTCVHSAGFEPATF
ncbi:hypothetical protein ACFZCU_11230 [Streptomyces canus]|uniref:hypothetical protein n=1 Tax=Streptomyces canus TaxID=58343 RepID=UPI0036EA4B76